MLMPFVDDMEEESAIPRRVKQAPETVSVPVLHDFRVTLKRSVFISVFPQTVNCQTVTPGVNWRCSQKQEPVLVFQESETYFFFFLNVVL